MRALLIPLVVVALALPAVADPAERAILGERLYGTIGADETVVVAFDATAATSFSASIRPFRGTKVRLGLAITGPDGVALDVASVTRSGPPGTWVKLSKLALPSTGTYLLTISSRDGTAGGFDLVTSGASPRRLRGTATLTPSGSSSVGVDALPGDLVTLKVRGKGRPAPRPLVAQFEDPSTAATAFDPPRAGVSVTYAAAGTGRFDVAGEAGEFAWTASRRPAKAPRARRDVAELAVVGTISGTVTYYGAPAPGAAPSAKSARRVPARPAPPMTMPGCITVFTNEPRSWDEVAAEVSASLDGIPCRVDAALTRSGPYRVRFDDLSAPPSDLYRAAHTRALAAAASPRFAGCRAEQLGRVAADEPPSDPWYPYQYNLPQIRAPEAWEITTGDPSVVVAILDTGIVPHPDVDPLVVPGYDFVSNTWNDGDGWDPDPTDMALPPHHGLAVAGVAAARGNDRYGMCGVAWNVRIQPIRCGYSLPGTSVLTNGMVEGFDLAAAVRWAAGLEVPGVPPNPTPADVINVSIVMGPVGYDPLDAMYLAFKAVAEERPGCIMVAGAGNESGAGLNPYPSLAMYPAAYPFVIGVYALNDTLDLASYARSGPWCKVGAPGGDWFPPARAILVPLAGGPGGSGTGSGDGNFGWWTGSSFSSPHVAGVCALMKSVRPTLPAADAIAIIQETAIDLGQPGFDNRFAYGLVDARAAVERAAGFVDPADQVAAFPPSLSFRGGTATLRTTLRSVPPRPVALHDDLTVVTASGGDWLRATVDGTSTPAVVTLDVDPNVPFGLHKATVSLTTGINPVKIPVDVLRSATVVPDVVIVSALDAEGRVAGHTTTDAARGYAFEIDGLPPGTYTIRAMVDRDGTLAADRVDEFEGVAPDRSVSSALVVSPDELDVSGVSVVMDRRDAMFEGAGAGGGPIDGALAVRALDARTGVPVAGARVQVGLGGGAPTSVTDDRGRAVVLGGFVGAQTVTLTADGYLPSTRSGQDAQYLGFSLEPAAPRPVRRIDVTLTGLAPSDHDVEVRIGGVTGSALHTGVDPVVSLDVPDDGTRIAITACARDADGVPTRSAIVDTPDAGGAVSVALATCDVRDRYAGAGLPGGMDAAATLEGVQLLRSRFGWVELGASALVLGDFETARWPLPIAVTPSLTRFEVRARDAAGRSSTAIAHASTSVTAWPPTQFTLPDVPSCVSPPDGASSVDRPVVLRWTPSPGARLHHVVLTRTDAPGGWDVWVGGEVDQVELPDRDDLLPPSSQWRWTVAEAGADALDENDYDDALLDTVFTWRAQSAPAEFQIQ